MMSAQNIMKMYTIFAFFVLFVQIFSSYADQVPCPFNKECICNEVYPKSSSSLAFDYTQCDIKDGKLPQFDPAPNGKYHINYDFFINGADLRVIPAKHFSAFEFIGQVYLNHKPGSPLESTEINWDDSAFDGVRMVGMLTDGLDGLIPPPAALKNSDLHDLYVYNCGTPISLKDDSFKNLPSLGNLSIYNATIHEITPKAFSGLEDKLEMISLVYSGIRDFVSLKDAIKTMNNLNILDLSENSITEVKDDSFPEIILHRLYLRKNPIEKIDKKSFSTLKGLRLVDLSRVDTLTTADLAAFTDLKNTDDFSATFNDDKSLKSVVVSDAGQYAKVTTFDIGDTGVETMDSKVADLLEKYPDMFLYLDWNVHLKCEGLEWMSKIECPARMLIDFSKCADKGGQRLSDYLKSVDPESKCKENKKHKAANLPRLLQTRGNLAQDRQHRIGYRRPY